MGRCLGRAWAYAAAALLTLPSLVLQPTFAYGQDDEVITDPDFERAAPARADASASGDDEVIADPELEGGSGATKPRPGGLGWGEVYSPKQAARAAEPQPQQEPPDPLANTGIGRLEVVGQTAVDLHSEENLEDFYEARLRFGGEIDFRLSRRLRLSLGTRIDFAWYAPHHNDPALTRDVLYPGPPMENAPTRKIEHTMLDEDRFEVDIIPLAAYVDATITDGVHLRIGAQVISLGRMDGYSVTDMLAIYDLRPQAKADPTGLKLAQPAIRLDWDMSSWATLQLVYVPWFMPHLSRGSRDQYVARALTSSQATVDDGAFATLIDPSYQPKANEAALRFVGPAPDFRSPQAEARLNFRGSSFELALLGGAALEKMPSVYYTPVVNDLLLGGPEQRVMVGKAAELTSYGYTLADVAYHRYYLFGFDGSFDISPIQVNFEFSYSPERHLYASKKDGSALPLPNVTEEIVDPRVPEPGEDPYAPDLLGNVYKQSIRKGVPLIQAALHLEYLLGETLLLAGETFVIQALELPYDRSRNWLGFPAGKGTYLGGLIMASYSVQEGKYLFQGSALLSTGPSYIITPQIEFQVLEGFYLNVGAQLFEGPTPNNFGKVGRAATNFTPGGAFSGYDNAYVGFRWLR